LAQLINGQFVPIGGTGTISSESNRIGDMRPLVTAQLSFAADNLPVVVRVQVDTRGDRKKNKNTSSDSDSDNPDKQFLGFGGGWARIGMIRAL